MLFFKGFISYSMRFSAKLLSLRIIYSSPFNLSERRLLIFMRNIPTDIFNLSTVKHPVAQGSVIVAEPFLAEPYFNHAVIAIISHDVEEGSMGVVLNIRSGYTLDDLIENVDSRREIPVFCGGPVGLDRLYFIHRLGPDIIPGATKFAPGLWIGGDFDAVTDYVNSGYRTDGVLRFFLGYSGWTYSQLSQEIEDSVWAVAGTCHEDGIMSINILSAPTANEVGKIENTEHVNTTVSPYDLLTLKGDALWHHIVRRMGPTYRTWLLHPRDTRAN